MGEKVRFDTRTEEFGVVSAAGFIKTYFYPDIYEHNCSSNLGYFQRNCTRYESCT
jgi:hypothetical protein